MSYISIVCSDELLSGNTAEDTTTQVTPTEDIVENIEKSSEDTTNTANVFKMEPNEHKKFEECKIQHLCTLQFALLIRRFFTIVVQKMVINLNCY